MNLSEYPDSLKRVSRDPGAEVAQRVRRAISKVQIRRGRTNEWRKILAVSDRVFHDGRPRFLRDWPHSYTGPEAADHCVVAEKQGTLVGAVNVASINLRLGNARLPAGILCGVCVVPEARGQGIMSAMISFAQEDLRHKGIFLSLLWGARSRYAHFGYEIAGQSHFITVRRDALKGITPAHIRRLGPADAATVLKLHRRDVSSMLRPMTWQQRLLSSTRTETLGCGRLTAYATVARRSVFAGDVLETGGDETSIARLLLAVMRRRKVDKVRVWCGPESAAARLLYPRVEQTFGADVQIHAATQAAILDYAGFLAGVAPTLGESFRRLGIRRPVVVRCSDQRTTAVLRPTSRGLSVQTVSAQQRPDVTGDARSWVRRFFPPPGASLVDSLSPALPAELFALPFIYPPWDIA